MDGLISVIIRQKEAKSQKGVFQMKNTFKLFAIITMAAVIVFSMAACGEDPGDDKVPKILVITGVPQTDGSGADAVTLKDKQITVAIFHVKSDSKAQIVALDQFDITFSSGASTTTVKSNLVSGNERKGGAPFTGTGLFYVTLFIDKGTPDNLDDDAIYMYGSSQLVKQLSITDETTTVAWSEFAKQEKN
jgi:hypothetical protein